MESSITSNIGTFLYLCVDDVTLTSRTLKTNYYI